MGIKSFGRDLYKELRLGNKAKHIGANPILLTAYNRVKPCFSLEYIGSDLS